MVTGTSVLGVTFDGGVVLAADTLGEILIRGPQFRGSCLILVGGALLYYFRIIWVPGSISERVAFTEIDR